jgi:hypothetical protein
MKKEIFTAKRNGKDVQITLELCENFKEFKENICNFLNKNKKAIAVPADDVELAIFGYTAFYISSGKEVEERYMVKLSDIKSNIESCEFENFRKFINTHNKQATLLMYEG